MATSPRRNSNAQFKAEVVQMVVQNHRPSAQVARERQIKDGTLGNWVKLCREENPEPGPELVPSDRVRLAELETEVRKLRMENELLKNRSLLRQGAGLSAKSALILAEKDNYPIAWMRQELNVIRSSFNAWRAQAGTVTATQARRDALKPEIQ